MNTFIDRKRLGISEVFSSMHPIFSPSNDMNAKETVRLMCEQKHGTRARIAAGINAGLRKITHNSTVDVDEYLNDEIRNLSENPVRADTLNMLVPFMEWLMELHRQNSLAIDRSQYSLNDAANHMEKTAGEFLRCSSTNMMWQNISLTQEEDGLLMAFQERFWGKAGLFFPHVRTSFEGTLPLVGMLFCIEAEHTDAGFEFSFVVNVEFGTDDMELRAIQNRNWVRLTFACDRPELRLSLFDYGATLRDFGKRGRGFIEDWCAEAVSKEQSLGSVSLSEREQELLPLAKILRIAYQLAEVGKEAEEEHLSGKIAIPGKVLELLGNRYRVSLYEPLFKETGQQALYDVLKSASEAWDEDEHEVIAENLWDFAHLLDTKEREDELRALYDRLTGMMLACTSAFDGVSGIYGTYPEAEEKMRVLIEPKLLESGFTGSYPHYRRRRGKRGEYISVLTPVVNRRTVNGVMTYYFCLAAAVKKLERRGKRGSYEYFAAGMPFEDTTAEDCRAVSRRYAKFAELGGAFDDESAEIHIELFDGIPGEGDAVDTADALLPYVDVALLGFKGKPMPRRYQKKRRRSPVKPVNETTVSGMFMKFLPIGLYIAVLLMGAYVVCNRFWDVKSVVGFLDRRAALLLSLLAGLVIPLVCAVTRRLFQRRHIWRY